MGALRILHMLNRRKWLALIAFSSLVTAGLSVVTFLPDIFVSSATVLIEHQQIPEELVRSTVTSTLETRLQTIRQEMLSRSRLEELINRFDLYPDWKGIVPSERLAEMMRNEINVELRQDKYSRWDGTTVAFQITYLGGDPQKVADVTNTLASLYIAGNLEVRERQAAGTSDFLSSRLGDLRKELDEQERRRTGFKGDHLGELPHQQDGNLKALDQLALELRENLANQEQANERRASLMKEMVEAQGF
ncbi:MAG: hypothetical protein L0191_06820, partial [Acidobacteria bacterium]|nr:hypothetical protein [Acidobacteriota bacterium]